MEYSVPFRRCTSIKAYGDLFVIVKKSNMERVPSKLCYEGMFLVEPLGRIGGLAMCGRRRIRMSYWVF